MRALSTARTLKAVRLATNTLKCASQKSYGSSGSNKGRQFFRCNAGLDPSAERALVGENFGARDPFAAEIESNFGEKVLGNYNTEHIIKPPDAIKDITGLLNKKCVPCEGGNVQKLEESDCNRLRQQCPGWRISKNASGTACISCEWKVKNFSSGIELMKRIADLADTEGHHPDLHLTGYNNVTVELTTHAVGGLTLNDFIIAAKVNEIETSDLTPKKKTKFWA